MKKIVFFLLLSIQAFALERLPKDYLVIYGKEEAPLTIVQYYSFLCPHCVSLFRREFNEIKEKYINKGKVLWIFHPVPMDLLTVQGMDCLQKLSSKEKKIFLEAILEEVLIDDPKLSAVFMQKAMEVLGLPIPDLQEKKYLSETKAYLDAFQFLKNEKQVEAVPSIEVNQTFIDGKVPDCAFIEKLLLEKGIS